MTSQPRIRQTILDLPGSRIRAVYAAGQGVEGVIPLWVGEGDEPTPDFIRQGAVQALARGETFYGPNRGIPELLAAIRDYLKRSYSADIALGRIVVSASGMNALMIVLNCLIEAGDNAVVIGPIWPNGREAIKALGGAVRDVYLQQDEDGRWSLDLNRLFDACDASTRLIMLNSPGNPTGWVASEDELRAILDFARSRGIWILSDEVYGRIVYNGAPHAPSYYPIATADDPVVIVNSFSKNWSMTGWRLGWIVTTPALAAAIEKMTEFHVSHATTFAQWGGVAALNEGDAYVASLVERYSRAADMVYQALAPLPRIRLGKPQGAFYAFFAVDGMTDSLQFCIDMLHKARVGLAPGIAFGDAGEGRIRLCYAASLPKLSEALDRLVPQLK
ncbi:pyridoxal phosphate-dependent aminotransferase [uncultured Ferrovibrio sp.]|jgi:aspartate aminotransferase|uniref:pyridoxal phosphate-dependent aminotransferase n=1 Tax=uncultured Ferrovibrio sp. TaxID=1576913 RepID=UPI002637D9CC|nr:pyridoxal phosphate-dependent aminotransferase [uncultured Ferrovibrio sp.]